MRIPIRSLFAVSMIYFLLLAGCAGVAPADDAGGAAEKVTIELWFSPPSGGEGATCEIEVAVDSFNASNDKIFVNAVANPDAWNATRTAVADRDCW